MTLRMILSFVIAFAAAFITGKIVIPILVKMKVGQSIKEIGPTWHLNKQGTPTMGGVIFIAGLFVAMITAGMPAILRGELTHVFVFLFALVYGAIGFVDDYCKLKKKENTGLTGWQKLLLQVVAAVLFVLAMRLTGIAQAELYVPVFQGTVAIPVPV